MKERLQQLIATALEQLSLPVTAEQITVTHSKDPSHGDFASNIALVLAKPNRIAPRDLAAKIVAALERAPASAAGVAKIEVAGAGFINFHLERQRHSQVVAAILAAGKNYGSSDFGKNQRIHIEYVSANPTGPLHVGHGRGAAYGSALCRLLKTAGFDVKSEYYVNDAGRQMHILAVSVWLRYLQQNGMQIPFAANGYRGDYVQDLARGLAAEYGAQLVRQLSEITQDLPKDAPDGGDKELFIDALIERAQKLLAADYQTLFAYGLGALVADIKNDLAEFGVEFDRWFYESELSADNSITAALAQLEKSGHLYQQNGATWFKSQPFGDEKDRVVVRDNGVMTYFASDIAYHLNKLARGFDTLMDIWGADHHGYEPRVRAAIRALGGADEKFKVRFVQFAALFRGSEKLPMSTRAGEFVTLRQLRQEVGNDAARYFYCLRKCEQHMDFDLELAKSQSNDNPVYYVQYAHARICGVFSQLESKGIAYDIGNGDLSLLSSDHERQLIKQLARYPDLIQSAARDFEPHQISYYLRDLAQGLHSYYNACKFIDGQAALMNARLALISAVRQVIANALFILGVGAPEQM